MDEQERDYLRAQIRQLEGRIRLWKLATFTLVAVLVVVLLMGGTSSFMFAKLQVQRQRTAEMQVEAARAAEAAARLQAEQAVKQVDKETKEKTQ